MQLQKPKSVQLYNQIGNFWRIKGNAQRSIECFRRALAVSPHNAEVLLNLARVLLVLQYLDDATYLARRSLELQPPDRNAWEQYLTLGQIFKAYGHFQEAAVHLRHALELKPDLTEAAEALKEVESLPAASIHVYTLLIIVCLVGINDDKILNGPSQPKLFLYFIFLLNPKKCLNRTEFKNFAMRQKFQKSLRYKNVDILILNNNNNNKAGN